MSRDTARGLHPNQWTNATQLTIRVVNGTIHQNMVVTIDPPGGGRIQIIASGSWLTYRLLDSDDVETERAAFPQWMVVRADLVVSG